jgi:hypothetical protein
VEEATIDVGQGLCGVDGRRRAEGGGRFGGGRIGGGKAVKSKY